MQGFLTSEEVARRDADREAWARHYEEMGAENMQKLFNIPPNTEIRLWVELRERKRAHDEYVKKLRARLGLPFESKYKR